MNNGQVLMWTTIVCLTIFVALLPKFVPGHGLVPLFVSFWMQP